MAEGRRGPTAEALQLLDPEGGFPARLAADRQRLADLTDRLWRVSPQLRQDRLRELESLAHRLAGAAGTFGFPAVGDAALALEELLIEQREGLPGGERAALATRFAMLAAALDQAIATLPRPSSPETSV
jgi:periplasmic divalent cation tolerance protein